MNQFGIYQDLVATLARKRECNDRLKFRNPVRLEHWRGGKLIGTQVTFNDITNVGKNYIFNVMFNGGTQIANNSWFIGLINLTSFSALAAADTMSSHSGWVEFTSYSQANRVAWGSQTATSQSTANSTPAQFDITGSGTVKGVFITSNSTISGTTGTLWATALFGADVPVTNGDQLKITYTVSA